jgi:hypothetical protein
MNRSIAVPTMSCRMYAINALVPNVPKKESLKPQMSQTT